MIQATYNEKVSARIAELLAGGPGRRIRTKIESTDGKTMTPFIGVARGADEAAKDGDGCDEWFNDARVCPPATGC